MTRTLIGISGNVEDASISVRKPYLQSISRSGGIPVLLSPEMDEGEINECLKHLDGILMAGGDDIDPSYFGEEPIPELGEVSPQRDSFEMLLLKQAIQEDIPVFGICRGIQTMNVALGGTLWQDLPICFQRVDGEPCNHRQTNPTAEPSHSVSVLPDTRLADVLHQCEIQTNSHHHQAIRQPGEGFRISAYSEDGVPEAAEHEKLFFYCGVQWHPERLVSDTSALLFDAFIKACDDYRHRKG